VKIVDGSVTRLRVTRDRTRKFYQNDITTLVIDQQLYSRNGDQVVNIFDAKTIEIKFPGDVKFSQNTIDLVNQQLNVLARNGGKRLKNVDKGVARIHDETGPEDFENPRDRDKTKKRKTKKRKTRRRGRRGIRGFIRVSGRIESSNLARCGEKSC